MPSVNDDILNKSIRHSVYFQRYKSGQANSVLSFLNGKVFPDITRKLKERLEKAKAAGFDRGPWTTAVLKQVQRDVGIQTAAGMKVAESNFKSNVKKFAVAEADFQVGIIKSSLPISLDLRSPSPSLLSSIVDNDSFRGPPGKWWKNLAESTRSDIVGAVKIGLASGEKPGLIIKRLTGTKKNGYTDGVFQTARYRAEAITRTISSDIQNRATLASLQANSDVVKGYQFVATLDTRTTVICMGHDGKVFPLKDAENRPPLHWNCRSTIVAVVKSFDELGLKGKEIDPGLRASMRGTVGEQHAYPEWLSFQTHAIQNDALGLKRADIFRRGQLPLDRFYNDKNRELTLPQLLKAEQDIEADALLKQAELAKKQELEDSLKLIEQEKANKVFTEQYEALLKAEAEDAAKHKAEAELLKKMEELSVATKQAEGEAVALAMEKADAANAVIAVKNSEAELKKAVDDAVAAAAGITDAKQAGTKAKETLELALAKVIEKEAANLSAVELQELKAKLAKAKKTAYDKAWVKAKAAEKAALKASAKVQKASGAATQQAATQAQASAAAAVPKVKAKEVIAAQAAKIADDSSFVASSFYKNKAFAVDELLDASSWKKYGEQKGSNVGGFFTDPDGVKWYVKQTRTRGHARNEVLAGRLYALTGVDSAKTKLVMIGDQWGVASRIVDSDPNDFFNSSGVLKLAKSSKQSGLGSKAADGFATDAWLANWDVVGATGDNMIFDPNGKIIRVDAGGSMLYRAQGELKGSAFGKVVNEIDSLRGITGSNSSAAQVFSHLTDEEIYKSIDRVLSVTDKDLGELLLRFGPVNISERIELFETMIARREDLRLRRQFFYNKAIGLKPAEAINDEVRKLAPKWGTRVELKREAISEAIGPAVNLPETGPALLSDKIHTDKTKYAEAWKEWEKNLTYEQKSSISKWSGTNYTDIRDAQMNAETLGGKISGKGYNDAVHSLRIESAIHSAPRFQGNIKRGISWNTLPSKYNKTGGHPNFDVGDTFEMEALSSFTTREGTAMSFANLEDTYASEVNRVPILIHCEKSYSGMELKGLGYGGGAEAEVIVPRKAAFRISRIVKHPDKLLPTDRQGKRGKLFGLIEIFVEEISGKP